MSVIRHESGEVRLVWRLLFIVVLTVVVTVLLRLIPIILYATSLASRGMVRADAVARARTIVLEDPTWSTVLGLLTGLMSLVLVWFLIKAVERHSFSWETVGLDWRGNSLAALGWGALLAVVLYFAERAVGLGFGSSTRPLSVVLAGLSIPIVVQRLTLHLATGFGEEFVFRGYVQTRLVERYGALWGVLTASVVFTLLHLAFRPLPPVTIVTGVMLWVTVGALYHWSKSLYLVGMFHGTANTLTNTLGTEASRSASLTVYAIALLVVVAVALRRDRATKSA